MTCAECAWKISNNLSEKKTAKQIITKWRTDNANTNLLKNTINASHEIGNSSYVWVKRKDNCSSILLIRKYLVKTFKQKDHKNKKIERLNEVNLFQFKRPKKLNNLKQFVYNKLYATQ